MNEYPLGDYVVASTKSYGRLNAADAARGDVKFLREFKSVLSKSQLICTQQNGGFLELYNPMYEGRRFSDLAIKLYNTYGFFYGSVVPRLKNFVDPEELKAIIKQPEYFTLNTRKGLTRMSKQEQTLLYLAWEHKKYAELFPKWVLPTFFFSATVDPRTLIPVEEDDVPQVRHLAAYNPSSQTMTRRLNSPVIFGNAQTYLQGLYYPFSLYNEQFNPADIALSVGQRAELREFVHVFDNVVDQTSWYPFESVRNSIAFDGDELVVLDTNNLFPQSCIQPDMADALQSDFEIVRTVAR